MVRRYHLTYRSKQHTSLLERVQVEGRCAASGTNANIAVSEDNAQAEDSGGALPEVTGCPRLPPITFAYEHVEPFRIDGRGVRLGVGGNWAKAGVGPRLPSGDKRGGLGPVEAAQPNPVEHFARLDRELGRDTDRQLGGPLLGQRADS